MARSALTRRLFALHSWLGLLTGGLLLVVSLSGVALLFEPELDHTLNPHLLTVAAPPGARPSLDGVLTAARQRFPQPAYLRLRRISATPTDAIEVSVDQPDHTWTLAYFDPYTARYLGQRNARAHFFGWLLGLHYSLLAGKAGELVVALLGLALVLSVLTGAVVYRKHLTTGIAAPAAPQLEKLAHRFLWFAPNSWRLEPGVQLGAGRKWRVDAARGVSA
ncbi:PepSY domain-containing protein [Hymenobacter sp. YC55]|uniref:PepSY domain-containing protein n=1 Tax=Hymenobacter sp. YC55 TaxID=3034019 RepID=UPI0023F7D42B|nr:PepSY domain-containing protein [Hymenobacter sp. YC55]MDF7813461.1 PepSY domain-containing protein [Hymenobacter sp. YC55]